ncbi:type I phosphomannose isomerase catalytic subunit [Limnoglobus roseus]|uniref:Mannose-6-phosphate isomerase n=1 Tax=Limnoglobus roseus TaxID=2598579 RepID=A0A5C1AE36_9BACT|nr:type I phosphomannose isomerase catalytic subunit [Limnoglobus roseus]QEL16286.1 mannose-6-phosphate isomerase [Limnoglobus roseus]
MTTAYPLKFEPIFKTMLWGGTRLRPFLGHTASDEPTGEAWLLSDVDGSLSRVANGPLAGTTLRELLVQDAEGILGGAKLSNGRFPLLLKFLDAKTELSVQVHPNDDQAHAKKPGALGKTEAWVILDADPETSKLYAGFRPGVTADCFRTAMASKTTPDTLHQFTPRPGDCVFLEAGTVHAIGQNLMLFEVQQTSDITYRLYDWDRVDAKTKQPRELHVDDGLECSNFDLGPCHPVTPTQAGDRDELVACRYFTMHHRQPNCRIRVDKPGECRLLVVLEADGPSEIEWGDGDADALRPGDVYLLPANLGECTVLPSGRLRLLEIGLGEAASAKVPSCSSTSTRTSVKVPA